MTAAAVDPAAPWGWTPNGARRTAAPEINAFARSRAGRSIRARLSPSLAPRFAKQGRTDPAERVRHPTLNAYANERFLPVLEEIYSRLKAKADAAGLIQPAGDVESFWIPRRDWQDTLGWVWPTADPADDDRIMAEALEDAEALLEAAKDLPPISVRFSGAAVVPQSLMLMCTAESSNETLDSMAVLRKAAPRFRGGAWSLQESAVALGQQVSWNVAHFPKDTELWPVVQTFCRCLPHFHRS